MEEGVFRNFLFRNPYMDSKLRSATLKGNVPSLLELLAKDKLLLKTFTIENHRETPLHIAAMLGHLEFVVEVLDQEAELAIKQDSQGSTPLHLAAAKGYFNIVVSLLTINPDLCSICDSQQRNPLHVAAMKGHMDVLEFLITVKPKVDVLNDDKFVNTKDADGNTILHLAAAYGKTETIDFLIDKGVDPKIKNSRGLTALDLLAQGEVNKQERKRKWQNSMHKTLIVVATLLATMSFQASITPPGGLWQEDGNGNHMAHKVAESPMSNHEAGESIMANKNSDKYESFLTCNTISLVASLSIIMLFISGLPLKRRRITTWIAMLTMWVAITFMAATYAISFLSFTSHDIWYTASTIVQSAVMAWAALMALLFLCHIIRLFLKLVRKVLKLVRKDSKRRTAESSIA